MKVAELMVKLNTMPKEADVLGVKYVNQLSADEVEIVLDSPEPVVVKEPDPVEPESAIEDDETLFD